MSYLVRRMGCKARLLPKLLACFPEKITTFIDLFFGSGAVTFAMLDRGVKYITANDHDNDIFNLFMVVKERKDELLDALTVMPIHESLFKHWETHQEADPIHQAVRFLFLSSFSYLGVGDTLCLCSTNDKQAAIQKIQASFEKIQYVKFVCDDFRQCLPKLSFRDPERECPEAFLYCDPPYLGTDNNYQDGFTEQDTIDLFQVCVTSGMRFGISEFTHPLVMDLASQQHLYITSLGERRTLKNRQTEILITNYNPKPPQLLLFPGGEPTCRKRITN